MKFLPYLILFVLPTVAFSQGKNDSLINVLKKEIGQKDIYVQQKVKRIQTLQSQLNTVGQLPLTQQFDLYNALYHQYKVFIYDSAFKYAAKLIETSYKLNDKTRIGYARLKLGFILLSSGMFKEGFDSLRVVEVKYLPDSVKVDYYWLISRGYLDLNVYDKDQYYRKFYSQLHKAYMDSALAFCEPRSYYYYYLTAVKNLYEGNFQVTINNIEELFQRQTLSYPKLAVNYFDLGNAYNALSQSEKGIESIIMSSLCDIRAATKETAAMYTLARLLYQQGDTQNAYLLIQQALNDAEYYGARQRKVEIGSILPVIASAALSDAEKQKRLWLQYGLLITGFSVLSIIFGLIIFKQLKKLRAAETKILETNEDLQKTNQQLQEANKIKEEYIGYYFNINSEYLDKIEQFKKSVDQKLTAKKYDDIRFIINNINPKREREDLYVSFDKVFLKLFPDFVTTFNSYFNPEDRIVLKDGQLLNTELRIFALIRMGITETEEIARILNYSVNTIYAYKTRVRSKSLVPNEEFDEKIMEIRSV